MLTGFEARDMVNDRIASYMPGGNPSQELLDEANNWVYSDPRMRELLVMQHLEADDLALKHGLGRMRLIKDLWDERNKRIEEDNAGA